MQLMSKFRFPLSRTIHNYIVGRTEKAYLNNEGWQFSTVRAAMLSGELSDWKINYRPIDLNGKTVLDVGAGEGETAKFFLHSGAKRVIAIEADPQCFKFLSANAAKFNITPIFRRFQVEDLFMPGVDFVKIDIEGYEEAVLGCVPSVPVAVEIHGLQLRDKFVSAGWRVNAVGLGAHCICYGYWRC